MHELKSSPGLPTSTVRKSSIHLPTSKRNCTQKKRKSAYGMPTSTVPKSASRMPTSKQILNSKSTHGMPTFAVPKSASRMPTSKEKGFFYIKRSRHPVCRLQCSSSSLQKLQAEQTAGGTDGSPTAAPGGGRRLRRSPSDSSP